MRLIDFFDRRAAMHPAHPFLIDDLGRTTYGESQATTHRIANVLIGLGCQPGTKVSVFSPNRARAFECMLGLARAGAAWVPLNANNGLQENCHILRGFDVEILLYHSSLRDRVESYLPHAPGLRHAVCIDGDEPDGLQARMREAAAVAPPDLARDPDSVTAVFPTGGTTGLSKGAIWTHRTWQTMIANLLTAFPVQRPPVNLVVAPMTHAAGGVALMLMAVGATFVILPGFSPERVPAAIEQHRVTHLFLPPTAIYMLLAHPEVRQHDYSALDYLIYAAAPMSVDKLRVAMEVFGPVMAQTFGQAESPMLCTALTPREHAQALAEAPGRLASCGRATLLTEVAIMDDAGRLLPDGERGEIVVRGPLVMAGYYKNPDATAEASRHGWHHTSDIGYRDTDGYHYIVDRKRDMIISGGFNIYPSEIEQVLWSHDDVQDCAVIGVPDDKWGEMVKAFVEPKPGRTLQPEALAAFCRERLGSVKVPKAFEVRAELPRSAVGKVLKRSLREEAWKNAGRGHLMPAHIAPLAAFDAANAPEGLQALVDFVGYRPNALLTMARHDGLLPAVLGLVQATLRGPGPLDERLRFLVGCEASRVAGCGYSAAHAAHAATHVGVPRDQLAALDRHADSPLFTPRERAALALADAAACPQAPGAGATRDAAFAAVRTCFTEEEVLALVAVVSAFGWFNRWNSLVRSELEAEPATMVGALPWLGPLLDAHR